MISDEISAGRFRVGDRLPVRTSIAKANDRIDIAARARVNKAEHAAIYDAIKNKNVGRAREYMKRHVAGATGRLGLTTE